MKRLLIALALLVPACDSAEPDPEPVDWVGTYELIAIRGHPLPMDWPVGDRRIVSGTLTIDPPHWSLRMKQEDGYDLNLGGGWRAVGLDGIEFDYLGRGHLEGDDLVVMFGQDEIRFR